MMAYLLLLGEFGKIGLFSIGGGLATLPFIFQLAEGGRYGERLKPEMIPDMLAVAQSCPGGVGVNLGIYTGFRAGGIPGGIIAALGLVAPSVIIIIFIAKALNVFKENPTVQAVFSGLRPAAAGLLTAAGYLAVRLSLYNPAAPDWRSLFRWREGILFVLLSFLVYRIKAHPIIYIAAAGIIGVILRF